MEAMITCTLNFYGDQLFSVIQKKVYSRKIFKLKLYPKNFTHKAHPFKVNTYAAGRASNIELLMLLLDFKVDYRLKILKSISIEYLEYLNEDT